MKRHYWCGANAVDSEDICPLGEPMAPIDDYACQQITAAGRLGDITPAKPGENHVMCPGQGDGSTGDGNTGNGNGGNGNTGNTGNGDDRPSSTTSVPIPTPTPSGGSSGGSAGKQISLKRHKTSGSGDDLDLDCTLASAASH